MANGNDIVYDSDFVYIIEFLTDIENYERNLPDIIFINHNTLKT